jgi:protein TonB
MRSSVVRRFVAWAVVAAFVWTLAALASSTPQSRRKSPTWISRPLPNSEELRRACPNSVAGAPIVNVHLLADGTVGEVKVVRSGGCKAADQLIGDAVRRWTFKPALEDGKPVPLWLTLSVSISMR